MIIALGVMFVTSLLLVAAFTAVNGDINTSHENVTHQQAYYAALSGVQEYEYKLEANSSYWENCEPLSSNEEGGERYEVTLLAAEDEPKGTTCSTSNPFETEIESSGAAANTFRILSVGCAGSSTLTSCSGTEQVERLDALDRRDIQTDRLPRLRLLHPVRRHRSVAQRHERNQLHEILRRKRGQTRAECQTLIFSKEDSVTGPMHTDDAANVTCSKELTFGRKEPQTARYRRNQRRHLASVHRRQ